MSLLLDALKKAAHDKQKNTGEAAPAKPVETPAIEQELTLELDALSPSPLTGEGDVQRTGTTEAALQSRAVPVTSPAMTELPTLAADITPPPAEIRYEAAVVPKPAKAAPTSPPPPLQLETEKPAPQVAAPIIATASSTLAAQQAAAKQRDALNLMINKSRQAGDQQRNMVRYGLAIFCLLLIFAGAYFYSTSTPVPVVADIPQSETLPTPIVDVADVQTVQQQSAPNVEPAPTQRARTTSPKPRRNTAAVAVAPEKSAAEPLQFNKTTRADPIETLLGQAYEKFQAADYDGANALYVQVLQREPQNRDGLLGAAAVAVKQQRLEFASQQYQQLLVLDPKDSLARAGLSSVNSDARDESQLKSMLREQPQAAHLYFALGTLYAKQNRWAEAQQAYFSAFSADSSNADYAYNLAVSLDRLGQYKTASGYYQKALQLAETHRGGFTAADLQTRIDQIARIADAVK